MFSYPDYFTDPGVGRARSRLSVKQTHAYLVPSTLRLRRLSPPERGPLRQTLCGTIAASVPTTSSTTTIADLAVFSRSRCSSWYAFGQRLGNESFRSPTLPSQARSAFAGIPEVPGTRRTLLVAVSTSVPLRALDGTRQGTYAVIDNTGYQSDAVTPCGGLQPAGWSVWELFGPVEVAAVAP